MKIAGSDDRCVTVYLRPEEIVSLEVKFKPQEIGKYSGYLCSSIIDNPEATVTINLLGEAYYEIVILEGLESTDIKYNLKNEKREEGKTGVSKSQRSSKPSSSTITSAPIS